MAEAVDRLELVPDEEDVLPGGPAAENVDEVALEAVRVLELVDHDRAKTQLLGFAHPLVAQQQLACAELQVFEVERRLPLLRRGVFGGEELKQLLQQVPVARGEPRAPTAAAGRARPNASARSPRASRPERLRSCSGFAPS